MEAIVLCGIQAAGKSTYARDAWHHSHVRISQDLLRTRQREDVVLHACLAVQVPLVIDNTNPTRAQRGRYLRLIRAAGYESAALYYFDTTVDDALRRNALRSGRAQVPELAIRGTARKMEVPAPDEGWDRLVVVRLLAEGGFVVEETAA